MEGGRSVQCLDNRAHEVTFALRDAPAEENQVGVPLGAHGECHGFPLVGKVFVMNQLGTKAVERRTQGGGVRLADLVRGRYYVGRHHLVAGGEDRHAWRAQDR